jgi:hypothetical protein
MYKILYFWSGHGNHMEIHGAMPRPQRLCFGKVESYDHIVYI